MRRGLHQVGESPPGPPLRGDPHDLVGHRHRERLRVGVPDDRREPRLAAPFPPADRMIVCFPKHLRRKRNGIVDPCRIAGGRQRRAGIGRDRHRAHPVGDAEPSTILRRCVAPSSSSGTDALSGSSSPSSSAVKMPRLTACGLSTTIS